MDQFAGNPGLSPEVMDAMNRRQGGAPAPQLSQVSPDARMASGAVPPPMPQSEMTQTSTPPAPSQSGAQKYQPQNQQDMIVLSLIEQLKSTNQLEKEKLKVGSAPASPSMPAPQASPESYLSAPSTAVMNQQSSYPLGGSF